MRVVRLRPWLRRSGPGAASPCQVVPPCHDREIEFQTLAGELGGDVVQLTTGVLGPGIIVVPWPLSEVLGNIPPVILRLVCRFAERILVLVPNLVGQVVQHKGRYV